MRSAPRVREIPNPNGLLVSCALCRIRKGRKSAGLRMHAVPRMSPSTDDLATLRQYKRCYILLMIGGYLMADKSNNEAYLRWLPLQEDFVRCHSRSWGSAVDWHDIAEQGLARVEDP
ncbi:hypothetical protein Ahy_A09g044036 [Arachis hypogaea]|uniref:Aminotransferase-like plant mobile domain-containing protein n=1 Tax=Arachis hypogaea TaxID=3818 RepID=A0A445BJF3_ARAHY|nr:hypothetical protein Ahy_A09g044036 [Arachis hypogaea]